MKKIISFISILACVFLIYSCGNDEIENPYAKASTITIDKAEVEFQCIPSQGTIECKAPNGISKVESNSSWCTASVSGSTVTVNVDQNLDRESRATKLKIYSGNDFAEVTIQQMGLTFCVNNGNSLEVSAAPMTHDLKIAYTGNKQYTVDPSEVDWATFSIEDDVLHVALKVNPNKGSRSTVAKLSDGESTTEVKILHNGLSFIVNNDNSYVAGDDASTKELTIEATPGITYTVAPSTVDWATFSIKDGALVVKLAANDTGDARQTTATITYAGELTYTVLIQQFDFSKDIYGSYTLKWGSSSSTKVDLEDAGGGDILWRFTSGNYVTMGWVMPATIDTDAHTMLIKNIIDIEGSYVKEGTTYKITTFVMSQKGSSIYRHNNSKLGMVGSVSVDNNGKVNWTFTDNGELSEGYSFYALRMGYGTGGYKGYVGNYVTFTSPKLVKD